MPSFAPFGIPGREKPAAPMPRVRPNLPLPVPADPEDPSRVIRSHLQKDELGKSKGSCRAALVTRLHRTAALQEFWCNSYEEQQVCIIIAGHPEVVNLREQWTRVGYLDDAGNERHTRVDFHVLLANGAETLVSVKYDEKARRRSYLAEVRAPPPRWTEFWSSGRRSCGRRRRRERRGRSRPPADATRHSWNHRSRPSGRLFSCHCRPGPRIRSVGRCRRSALGCRRSVPKLSENPITY
jgi:hypothetical protein